jgi:transcriptional regulator with XRE-family HTH domain
MNLAKAVRTARAARGLSQKQLAELSGLDPSYVSLLEAGKRNPSVSIVESIARAMGVPSAVLMLFGSEQSDLKYINKEDAQKLGGALLAALAEARTGAPHEASSHALGVPQKAAPRDRVRPGDTAEGGG